jgi:hypothetical protein
LGGGGGREQEGGRRKGGRGRGEEEGGRAVDVTEADKHRQFKEVIEGVVANHYTSVTSQPGPEPQCDGELKTRPYDYHR